MIVQSLAVPKIPEDLPAEFDSTAKYICLRLRVSAKDDVLRLEYEEPVEKPDWPSALAHMTGAPIIEPPRTDNPLDVEGGRDQWLVIGFPPAGNIVFSTKEPGVSLKRAPKGAYGHLRHVTSDGQEYYAPQENCRLIRLAAMPLKPDKTHYADGFNLHVEVVQQEVDQGKPRERRLPIVLDPDIKYPGPNTLLVTSA
jgi:hypothetical protein